MSEGIQESSSGERLSICKKQNGKRQDIQELRSGDVPHRSGLKGARVESLPRDPRGGWEILWIRNCFCFAGHGVESDRIALLGDVVKTL